MWKILLGGFLTIRGTFWLQKREESCHSSTQSTQSSQWYLKISTTMGISRISESLHKLRICKNWLLYFWSSGGLLTRKQLVPPPAILPPPAMDAQSSVEIYEVVQRIFCLHLSLDPDLLSAKLWILNIRSQTFMGIEWLPSFRHVKRYKTSIGW